MVLVLSATECLMAGINLKVIFRKTIATQNLCTVIIGSELDYQDIHAKFEWDGLEKAFPEWAGMTTSEAQKVVDSMFEQWDIYKKDLLTNPQAKYLEYVVRTPSTTPSLNGETSGMGQMPTVPTIPTVPNVAGTLPQY